MAPNPLEPESPNERSIYLWPGETPGSSVADGFRPWMDPYLLETDRPLGAVMILPGGGYAHRSPRETAIIARHFNKIGLHAFVVHYRVSPHRQPEPLMDAARAIRLIRHRAHEWRVVPDRIAALGFSAGGHLAATLGVYGEDTRENHDDPIERLASRPDALVLCYAVLTMGEYNTHAGSRKNLLGEDLRPELIDRYSLENHVTERTPPTFLWHTANDKSVPVENCLMFAKSLSRFKVPFEMHVYPDGVHGLALAPDLPHVATWFNLCGQWLREIGW